MARRSRSPVPVTAAAAACARSWRRFPAAGGGKRAGRRAEGRERRFPPFPGRAPNRRRRHFTLPPPFLLLPARHPAARSRGGKAGREGKGRRRDSATFASYCLVGNCRAAPERPIPPFVPVPSSSSFPLSKMAARGVPGSQ